MTFGGAVFDFLTLFSFCLFTNKKGEKFENLNIKIDLFFEKSVEKSIIISRYYYIYYTEILYGLPEPLRVRLLAKKKIQCDMMHLKFIDKIRTRNCSNFLNIQ